MADVSDFPIGTTCRLKSGGPIMTVTYHPSIGGKLECSYFLNGEVRHCELRPDALDKVTDLTK